MTRRSTSSRRARGSISREEILAVARQFIENDGLQELTFPRLAEHMNASPSSLYLYFSSKNELLAAIVDDVTAEMYLRLTRIGSGPWDKEIIEYFQNFRALLQRTPVYREVFAYRGQSLLKGSRMAPFILRRIEDTLALFVRAGLTPDEAAEAFSAFSSFTRAFVLVEHGVDAEVDRRTQRLAGLLFEEEAAKLPLVSTVENIAQLQRLDDDLYRRGLRLLINGLCRIHPALNATRSDSGLSAT